MLILPQITGIMGLNPVNLKLAVWERKTKSVLVVDGSVLFFSLVLSREYGSKLYRDYIGILFLHSLLRTSKSWKWLVPLNSGCGFGAV